MPGPPSAVPSSLPGTANALRAANQRRVVDLLLEASGTSWTQVDIARETGLATGTVSTIVRELAAAGLVTTVAGAGRRGTTVRLGREAGLVAGVDVGHEHVSVALAEMNGTLLGERRERLDPAHEHQEGLALVDRLLVDLLRDASASKRDLRHVGMGLPAPITDGLVMSSAILPGWVGHHARAAAAAHLAVEVTIDNDANLGVLAEHRFGAARGYADVVFVKVSSGVGSGLMMDGKVFRGAGGTAGEIGHLSLDEQGPLCRCGGRGCLEAYAASGTALALMAEQLPGCTVDDVVAAARAGNTPAMRVLEDAGLHLGWGLAALTNLVNPGIIVVGGDMARGDELFLQPARQGMRRHVLAGAAATPIVRAELDDRASMIGAVILAIERTDLIPDLTAAAG